MLNHGIILYDAVITEHTNERIFDAKYFPYGFLRFACVNVMSKIFFSHSPLKAVQI